MRYIIIGAGAVGGAIGGRLAGAGAEVVLVARGAHRVALAEGGLRLRVPEGELVCRLPVVDGPAPLGPLRVDDVLILAVKTQDSEAALAVWGAAPVAGGGCAGERLPLFCAQNGVESQRIALRRFARVYGVCVWLPSTHVEPGVVAAAGSPCTGILHLGCYPHGTDELVHRVAGDLRRAKFEAPVVPDVMRWQYAKLLTNLGNSLEALGGREAVVALGERVREEGRVVLEAAGIAFVGGEEQKAVRGDKITLVPLPGTSRDGGSSWQSLARGTGSIEADYLNGEIALLGRLHGVPTPVNSLLQGLANEWARERRSAGSMGVGELVRRAAEAGGGS